MRRLPVSLLVLLAGLLFVGGCKSNNKGKIEGTKWTSIETPTKSGVFPAGEFFLEFRSDGKLIFRREGMVYTGTYTVESGDNVTFHLDRKLQGSKTHTQKIKIADDQLTLTDGDGTAVTFTRMK